MNCVLLDIPGFDLDVTTDGGVCVADANIREASIVLAWSKIHCVAGSYEDEDSMQIFRRQSVHCFYVHM